MKHWRIAILLLMVMGFLVLLSGCQVIQPLTRGVENTFHTFSTIPDKLAQGISNLMGSISNVGDALADSIRNIIQNMTGK